MKKTNIIMIVTLLIAIGMITKAFIMNDDVKMKEKGWKTKVLFFTVLLGLGLPFQSWFRNNVLFSMDSSFLMSSIITMVLGVLFMSTFFSYMTKKRQIKVVE